MDKRALQKYLQQAGQTAEQREQIKRARERAHEKYQEARRRASAAAGESGSFKDLKASELYCPQCKCAMPVKQRLLLVLPTGEKYDYVCTGCGNSLGTKTSK